MGLEWLLKRQGGFPGRTECPTDAGSTKAPTGRFFPRGGKAGSIEASRTFEARTARVVYPTGPTAPADRVAGVFPVERG
jgi:hypothetical protein